MIIKIKNNLDNIINYSEKSFREEVARMISIIVKDDLYSVINANTIAVAITGVNGDHGVPEEGMKIINEELIKYITDHTK